MEDFNKIQDALLSVQEKHIDFFMQNKTIITDYVDFIDNPVLPLKFKNELPPQIIDEFWQKIRV